MAPPAACAVTASAVTLGGAEVAVPQDLAERSLLVATFRRAANDGAREWRSRLDEDPRFEGWSSYSVIVLAGAPGLVRRLVARSVRREVPEDRHESFLLVNEDAESWRTLVGSFGDGDEDGAEAVFVVRIENGQVCARHRGPVSDRALNELLGAACPP